MSIRKNLRLIIPVLALVLVLAVALLASGNSANSCGETYRNDERIEMAGKVFKTEVAKGGQELNKGLGGRKCIDDNQAMLLKFDQPGQYGIWMKDMEFSIDVLWINPDKKIVAIEKQFSPETYPENAVNEKDKPALYVMEVRAGTADKLGLQLGSPVNF